MIVKCKQCCCAHVLTENCSWEINTKIMAADEYIPCLKCDAWVPHYAKEIHMAECHELSLKQFTHPYITGSSLFGQVTFMVGTEQSMVGAKEKDPETVKSVLKNKKNLNSKLNENNQNKNEKIGNESQVPEPEWLKKILASLHYRAVLMNERDLIRCDITAYTPVEVKTGSISCGFLAIPERVRIGHLLVHQGSHEGYCKDKVYYNLKKIMETALRGSGITDSPLLGRWSGVLLYGPPGTGKTLMVHEMVAELSVPVFTLTLATVSKSSRSTKEYVQYIFGAACQSAPSVLFIDELESLCPAADLKMQADKTFTPYILQVDPNATVYQQTAQKPVFLLAATCQPSRVSSKLRSPGRLERELMVPTS
ncbi:ATPase family gene 2 protein homolog A-like isoform X6 [Scylla paramamosain]|uniref:ATPase family gene 2 protein homolog A-like isoform X6 n=1 Tax=Scylla paramamosain TaxID=85552 RepID=UPI0030831B0A